MYPTVLPRSKAHVLVEKAMFCMKPPHQFGLFTSACGCNRVISKRMILIFSTFLLYALPADQNVSGTQTLLVDFCPITIKGMFVFGC